MEAMGRKRGETKVETGETKNLPQLVLLSHVCSVSCTVPGIAGRQPGPGPRESPLMTPVPSPLSESCDLSRQ